MRCSDCDVDLVPDPPPSDKNDSENTEYRAVLSTSSPSDVALIKSLLGGEGIDYLFQGETAAPYMYYAIPMRLLVRADQVEDVVGILRGVDLSVGYISLLNMKRDEEG